MLSLREAIKEGKLDEFIKQEEKRGIGPAEKNRLENLIKSLATEQQSEDQTSRSRDGGNSSEK
jgi:hypothetical protein